MLIRNIRLEKGPLRSRLVATVSWEDCGRPERDVYYETVSEYADGLTLSAHPFIVGCCLPAMFFGERRLKVDGTICPVLYDGLVQNMAWYRHWKGEKYQMVTIEAEKAQEPVPRFSNKQAGMFISGGVDSFYLLRKNRLNYPGDHPSSIKFGFFVHGFDIYHDEKADKNFPLFDRTLQGLQNVERECQMAVIPVYTNVRHLYGNVAFWMQWYFGAALSSVAHAFSSKLNKVSIASGFSIRELLPFGSHPITDVNFGSRDLEIVHDLLLTRIEKIAVVAQWDTAINNLRVCVDNPPDRLNCCRCEKCVRTMLALLCVNRLQDSAAFVSKEIPLDVLSAVEFKVQYQADAYTEMLDSLIKIGRQDIVDVIRERIQAYERYKKWKEEKDFKGLIKRFDRKYLGNGILKLINSLRNIFRSGHVGEFAVREPESKKVQAGPPAQSSIEELHDGERDARVVPHKVRS